MNTLYVSDDEVLAIGYLYARDWRSPVPTVDMNSAAALLAAVSRGSRSLAIRELSTGRSGEPPVLVPEVATFLAPVIADGPKLSSFVTDSELAFLKVGPTMLHYGSYAGWVSEVVTAEGVHLFTQSEVGACWEVCDRLAQAAWTAPESEIGNYFCVSRVDEDPRRVIAVRTNQVHLFSVHPETNTVTELGQPRDVQAALATLR